MSDQDILKLRVFPASLIATQLYYFLNNSSHATVHCGICQTILLHACMEVMRLGQLGLLGKGFTGLPRPFDFWSL